MRLADVYHRGDFPVVAPNPDLAADLYRACCASPDPSIASLARRKYVECRLDPVAPEDVAGRTLSARFANDCVHATRHVATVPTHDVNPSIPSDSQNVHDHALSASLRRFARSHAPGDDAPGDDEAFANVVDLVLQHGDDTERQRAYAVLESLSDAPHSKLDMSERQALRATWATIQALPQDDIRANARETLVKQLASGVEDDQVVCSTGKIARIVGTLDGIAQEQPGLRPMWAVKDELGTLAARVRDSQGDAETFRHEVQRTYVDELGMHPALLEPLVDDIVQGF
jgi:hypothetical protein